jgi:signal transduction histidine kinase
MGLSRSQRPAVTCLALALLATLPPALAQPATAPEPGPRTVLVIDAYGGEWGTTRQVIHGLKKRIAEEDVRQFDFLDVSLESRRSRSPEAQQALQATLVDHLRALFSNAPPALIITVGWPAAAFLSAHRAELFPRTPALFTGAGAIQLERVPLTPRDASVGFLYDPAWAVQRMLELAPGTSRLLVVEGASDEERTTRAVTEPYLRQAFPGLEQEWTTELRFQALLERVHQAKPGTVVVFSAFEVDAAGRRVQDVIALPAVVRASPVPVFGAYEHLLGTGVAATLHFDTGAHIRQASEAALALLRGEPPERHRAPPQNGMGQAVDAAAMARWGLSLSGVSPDTRVIHAPRVFWRENLEYVLGGLGVAGLQAALILVLVASRRRLGREQAVSAQLRRKLVTAQEDEQRRVARELHDDFAQRLGRLALDAARLTQPSADVPAVVAEMRDGISRLAADVSAMSYRLHPATLEDLGLEEAIRLECSAFGRREHISVQFTGALPGNRLAPERALALFRVLQEALRNVSRHAQASHVQVTLAQVGERVQLAVRDDGVGFTPGALATPGPHLGHASMRERMALIGGDVAVESEPGGGTTVAAWTRAA